jgi:hypothetical protein
MTGTLRRKLLDRMLMVNENHLRRVLTEYLPRYNDARPPRPLASSPPVQADSHSPEPVNLAEHRIRRSDSLTSCASCLTARGVNLNGVFWLLR